MTKKKSKLPEHDHTDNCPACAEIKKRMDEMEQEGPVIRLKALAEHINKVHDDIRADFPNYRVAMVFEGTVANEFTDEIGTSPKTIMVQGPKKEVHELMHDLNKRILLPEIMEDLGDIFKAENPIKGMPMPTFFGKPGEA